MTRAVNLPDRFRLVQVEVRDPTVADERLRVAATLSVNEPSLVVKHARESDLAQSNATKRQKWTQACLREAGGREVGPDTFRRMVDAAVGDGGAWTKLVFNKDVWENRYSIKQTDFEEIDNQDDAGLDVGQPEKDKTHPGPFETEGDDDEPIRFIPTRAGAMGEKKAPDAEQMAATGEVSDEEDPLDAVKQAAEEKRQAARTEAMRKYNAATEDAKKDAGVPFEWVLCDALCVYPVYQGRKVGEVLEVQERPISSTFREYRLKFSREGAVVPEELGEGVPYNSVTHGPSIEFLEHWDDTWVTYAIVAKSTNGKGTEQGRIVKQWKHGYGRHPYFFAPGLWLAHWRNRKVGWSISETKRWLVEYRSFLWTLHAQVAARDAFAPLFRELPDTAAPVVGVDGKPTDTEQWQLGAIYNGQPGEKLVPIQFPQIAKALMEQIKLVDGAIEKLEPPRFSGNPGGMEGAGFAISQVLAEARTRFNPIVQSVEKCLNEITRFAWDLVRRKVKENVWAYKDGDKDAGWISIGPDDLTDSVAIQWTLDPELPSAKLIESRYWNERVQAGTASLDQSIEEQGSNPDEVRLGKILDRLRNSPWYIDYVERYVLAAAARGDLMKQAAAAAQMATTGAVPPGQGANGTPGGMGNDQVPDMGNLAASPNGAGPGGAPAPAGPNGGSGIGPGGQPGGIGTPVPQAAGAASIARLGS